MQSELQLAVYYFIANIISKILLITEILLNYWEIKLLQSFAPNYGDHYEAETPLFIQP